MNQNAEYRLDRMESTTVRVTAMLIEAEQDLRSCGAMDLLQAHTALLTHYLEKHTELEVERHELWNVFTHWHKQALDVYQKSEVTRSISLLKRLDLVSKNILHIAKKELSFPDLEGELVEIQMMKSRSAQLNH
ncbi:MAG: deoxyribodipyrimidine photolyase [Lentisphaeria bacterium]|jgi:deoxyribodipyrimidine photolyase